MSPFLDASFLRTELLDKFKVVFKYFHLLFCNPQHIISFCHNIKYNYFLKWLSVSPLISTNKVFCSVILIVCHSCQLSNFWAYNFYYELGFLSIYILIWSLTTNNDLPYFWFLLSLWVLFLIQSLSPGTRVISHRWSFTAHRTICET